MFYKNVFYKKKEFQDPKKKKKIKIKKKQCQIQFKH